MSKNTISKIEQQSAYDYIKNAYRAYGADVVGSGYQTGRMFCDVYDGLKISYRHLIQVMYEEPNQFVKVQTILGDVMKKYHFHGVDGAQEIVYSLANDYKCVEVQGNSGARTMSFVSEGAAPRYTEARLKSEVKQQLKDLMPFVPEETTVTGYKEKRYIPTPIPLGLVAGTGIGMGIGIRNNLPAFTAESLLEAYLKNDYKLLRLNYGYSLSSFFDDSEYDYEKNKIIGNNLALQEPSKENLIGLKDLWETGEGKLKIYIPMYKCTINNMQGFMLICDPKLFIPNTLDKDYTKQTQLMEWKKHGLVEAIDFSDGVRKLFIGLTPRTKKITLTNLKKEIYENARVFQNIKYQINIATEKVTGKVGIYDWVNFTYNNYKNLYKQFIDSELKRLYDELLSWKYFREIVDLLLDKKKKWTDEEIVEEINKKSKKHKISVSNVEWVGSKPYNTIRNSEPKDKIAKIEELHQYYKTLNIDDQIKTFIKCWN